MLKVPVVGVGLNFFALFCFYPEKKKNLKFKKSFRKSKTYLEALSFTDKEAAAVLALC